MRRGRTRWHIMTVLLWIGVWWNISGCASKLPEPIAGLDTAWCRPSPTQECISVSPAFVQGRLDAEERIVRCQLDLRSYRRAHP